MGDFRKLEVWQIAHKVACEVYQETVNFPKTEAYGSHDVGFLDLSPFESLSAQVRRVQGMLAGLNRALKKRP